MEKGSLGNVWLHLVRDPEECFLVIFHTMFSVKRPCYITLIEKRLYVIIQVLFLWTVLPKSEICKVLAKTFCYHFRELNTAPVTLLQYLVQQKTIISKLSYLIFCSPSTVGPLFVHAKSTLRRSPKRSEFKRICQRCFLELPLVCFQRKAV